MRAFRILAKVLAGIVVLVALLFGALQTAPAQRLLADLISGKSLQVSGLGGFLPTDLQVARLELLDSQGAWLKVENARLRWSFASLLEGRVRVEVLSASRVDVQRSPISDEKETTSGSFKLPIGVELQALSIETLHLGPALAEVESSWRLQGDGLLSADMHEGRVRLSGDRRDGPQGKLSADMRFDLARRTVDGEIALDEGQGGVLAALLQRPDLDRVSVKLVAKGDAASGNAELTVSAGDAATATGSARWQPAGNATAISARLEAQGTKVVEYGGPVALTADATVDGALVNLTASTITAGPLALSATGRYDRNADHLDSTVSARFGEPGPLARFVEGVHWRDLQLEAHAVLDEVAKQPHGSVSLKGSAEELVVAALEGRLPPLGRITFAADAGMKADGSFTLQSFETTSSLATVRANDGSFVPETKVGEVKATVDLPSLAPFSTLAQRELAGRGHVELSARKDAQGITIGWQGTLVDAGAPGVPPGLIAHEVRLSGTGKRATDDRWSLADVRVESEAGTFEVTGSGQGSTGRFDLSVDLRQLATLRQGVNGAMTASATVELRPDGAAGGSLTAQGNAENQPLSLAGRFDLDAAGGIVVPSFEGHWASVALDVKDLSITQDRISGSAKLKVEKLQEIGELVGTPMSGSIEATLDTDPQLAAGRLQVHVHGRDVQSSGMALASLQLDATVNDPTGAAATDARIAIQGLRGVADLTSINGTVKGDRQGGLDVAMQVGGAQTSANFAARVELPEGATRIALSRFDGRRQGIPIALAAPTRVNIAGQRVSIDPTNLTLGGGRLSVRGVVDPAASDLNVELTALPLSLVDTLAPGTGVDGSLQARARVTGAMSRPRIEATYAASNVRLRRPDAALLPSLALQGTAAMADSQANFDARLTAGAAGNLTIRGRMAMAPLAGSTTITGAIDLAPLAPLLGNQIRNVTGTLRSNLTVEIAGSRITGSGSLDLANANLSLPEAGMRLSGGTGRLVLQGETVQVQNLAFQTGRSGGVTTNGTLRLDAEQGVVVDLAVVSNRALLVSRPDLVATVSSNLKITGSTGAGIDVAGPITIDRAEIAVGAGQTGSFPTIEVREINKAGAANAPPPPPQPVHPAPKQPSAMPVKLALTVSAPQAIFVRGRGLDAEMSGSFQVTGDPSAPSVTGGLTLRRGDFNLAGRRLVFSRGVVTLDNLDRIDPRLDFVATTSVQSTTIEVKITGTPRAPVIAITSSPPLPQDEAMALLLFGKPASGLSAFELISVAQSLAELTGKESPTTSVLGRLRQGLGLDQLRLGSSDRSGSGVSLEAGRYVAPGVYVGARQGAGGNSSRGVVEIEVLDNTKIEGDIGADSNGRVGVKMEWDY
jgi:translocation and assembly module TamB